MRSIVSLSAMAVAISVSVFAGSSFAQDKPVKLGVMLPLSGPAALAGTSILEGIQFAAEENNAKGGVLGQQVELVIEDDEGNATKGVTAVRKLIEQEGVAAISGTYVSGVALAATKVAREFKVPMISAGSTSSDVTDYNEAGDPWFFRAFPGSRIKGPANTLIFANADAASGVRNILKMKGGGLEVGPILMGMGNRAHIVTPSITPRGLLNMAAIAGTPVAHYG